MSDLFTVLADVEIGAILKEDVYANTIHPIIRKDTTLTDEHLHVLRMFAVQEIQIKSDSSRQSDKKIALIEDAPPMVQVKTPTFQMQYIEAVEQVKKEFMKWRSGTKPDVAKVRKIIVPLVEQLKRPETELAFLTSIATKDEYIYHHSVAVGLLAYAIGEKMNLSVGESIQLSIAGTLIDCGMARISPHIIQKTSGLTAKEYNEIKKHPVYGYQMVSDSLLLRGEMKSAILQHHERLDGSGYPRGEKGENISLYAQILGAADVYHARISDRIYREKESPYKVLESFKDNYEVFNVQVINALYEVTGRLSIGTRVRLSNGETGTIIYLHQAEPFRPIVKMDASDANVDLTRVRSLTIEEVL